MLGLLVRKDSKLPQELAWSLTRPLVSSAPEPGEEGPVVRMLGSQGHWSQAGMSTSLTEASLELGSSPG